MTVDKQPQTIFDELVEKSNAIIAELKDLNRRRDLAKDVLRMSSIQITEENIQNELKNIS